MPTYKIKDPDSGKTISITGDSPPTEEELEEIFTGTRPSALAPSSDGLASRASRAITKEDKFDLAKTPVGIAKQIAEATRESLVPDKEGLNRLFDPNAGKFGASRILEALGKKTGKAVRAAAQNTAEDITNKNVNAAPVGAIYSTIADILSDSLTPSAMQQQVGAEGAGVVGGKAASAMVKKLGQGGAKFGQMMTGVKSQQFERLARDPGALFTAKTKAQAGELMEEALEKAGAKTAPTSSELFDPQLSKAREIASEVYDKIAAGEPVSAQEVLKARQATDRIIAGTSFKDKPAIQRLTQVRTDLNELLGKLSPELAEASREYARSALAGQFRRALPVTAAGEPSLTRSVVQPLIAAASGIGGAGVPAAVGLLAASSPVIAGLVTSLSSMSTQAAGKILSNPAIRRLLVAEFQKFQREGGDAGTK